MKTLSLLLVVLAICVPAHAQRSFAYVANPGAPMPFSVGSVAVIDVSQQSPTYNTVVETIPVGYVPFSIAISADGSFAYVTLVGSFQGPGTAPDEVAVISTATNSVVTRLNVGPLPRGITAAPHKKLVYVAVTGADSIAVIDTTSNTVVDTIPLGAGLHSPLSITFSPDGRIAYATALYPGPYPQDVAIAVIDLESKTTVASGPVGLWAGGNERLAITPDGRFLYVVNDFGDYVAVVSTQTNTLVATVPVRVAGGLAVTPDGRFVYTGNGPIISTKTNTVVSQAPLQSYDIAFTHDGQVAYYTGGICTKALDVRTDTVVATIPVNCRYYGAIAITPPIRGARPN